MKKNKLGQPAEPEKKNRNNWVQTERSAHEAWNRLIAKAPMAARLAHVIVANLGDKNTLVASQRTLGELMSTTEDGKPVHRNTVRRAIATLESERWIEVTQIGGKGGSLAYTVNDQIVWQGKRKGIQYSRFSAEVIASSAEQERPVDEVKPELRKIPVLMRGEQQLPSGPGEDPPSQPPLEGMEPDLPAIQPNDDGQMDLLESK